MRWFSKDKRIYLDYTAATPVDRDVRREMRPYFSKHFGNPGSVHREGQYAARAVEEARAKIAAILRAHTDEIIFTSGGTESNNLALAGAARFSSKNPVHIITTLIEHPSVLEVIRELERKGASVSHLGVGEDGRVRPHELREALRPDTTLVSIMYVNNEIGSIQPIRELTKVIRKHRKASGTSLPYFHIDASQAPLCIPLSVETLGADLLTLDAQKLYGPKGIGLLYKRRGVALTPIIRGGEQEEGLRAGTENVPLIVGFAKALALAEERRDFDNRKLAALQSYFISEIESKLPHVIVNGGMEHRVPSNVNISIPGIESAFMVVWLDAHGVACGSRSACIREDDTPSYVIRALGGTDGAARSSLRFTLGRSTSTREIDRAIRVLASMVATLCKEPPAHLTR